LLCRKTKVMFEHAIGKLNRFAVVIERQILIIGGCNGAGKTTMVKTLLPHFVPLQHFINADEIAVGMSPFHPSSMAIEAGRWMIKSIHDKLQKKESFAFETTLASRSYAQWIENAQKEGYQVNLLFLWMADLDIAKERVQQRVREGGHKIPIEVIERRYQAGLNNLFKLYLPLLDQVVILDNSEGKDAIIAQQTTQQQLIIRNRIKWNQMCNYGK
jgi:predicted ABC-type ATPase